MATAITKKTVSPPPQLTPWKKGQSGNPNGRPKDRLRPALRALLTDEDIRVIMAKAIEDAKHPDPEIRAKARAWLVEQCDGKLVDRQERGDPGAFDDLREKIESLTQAELRSIVKLADRKIKPA